MSKIMHKTMHLTHITVLLFNYFVLAAGSEHWIVLLFISFD